MVEVSKRANTAYTPHQVFEVSVPLGDRVWREVKGGSFKRTIMKEGRKGLSDHVKANLRGGVQGGNFGKPGTEGHCGSSQEVARGVKLGGRLTHQKRGEHISGRNRC